MRLFGVSGRPCVPVLEDSEDVDFRESRSGSMRLGLQVAPGYAEPPGRRSGAVIIFLSDSDSAARVRVRVPATSESSCRKRRLAKLDVEVMQLINTICRQHAAPRFFFSITLNETISIHFLTARL